MRLQFLNYALLLAGLDSLFVEPDRGTALLISHETKNSSQDTPRDSRSPDAPALVEMPSNRPNAQNASAKIRPESDVPNPSREWGSADAKTGIIRGHLHVDLSLRTNVELVARLTPLMLRLTTEQKALLSPFSAPEASPLGSRTARVTPSSLLPSADVSEGTSETSADSADTAKSTLPHAVSPEIQLELSYHIFDMEESPTSTPHCITGELGRFCAFPPSVMPTEAGSSERNVGGRAVVEETLLQLCLAKLGGQDLFTQIPMTGTHVPEERMVDEEPALRKDAVAGHSPEGKAAGVGATTAPVAQLSNTSVSGYSTSPGQRVRLLWRYMDAWCCNCSTLNTSCDHKAATDAVAEKHKTQVLQDDRATKTGVDGSFSPFEAACSRAQLAMLRIRVEEFMKNCEKVAAGVLQHQVDNRLSVVPSLLIDGNPVLGELTAASVMKTLCLVAEERAAAAASPGTPAPQLPAVCRTPDIMDSPALVVKSFGVGVNSQLISNLESGTAGELGVAAHLLNTYGRSPERPATHAAQAAAPTRPGMDSEGRYHFVNPKALRFLRKRMLARTSRRRRKIVPIVSADADSTASFDENSEAVPLRAPLEIFMKSSAAVDAHSATTAGAEASTDGDPSASPTNKSALAEKVDTVSEQLVMKAAETLTLEASPAGSFSVPPSEGTFHVEADKHDQRAVFDSFASQQQRPGEAVAGVSASAAKQFTDIIKPAVVMPCGKKTETAACVIPNSAAGSTFNGADAFTSVWSLHLFFAFVLLVTAVAWYLMWRKRTAVPFPPRQQGEPAAHQTALLGDKPFHTVPSRDL